MAAGISAVAVAWLLGGIPFGYLFYRFRHGRDVREVGSGNIGATNVARTGGWALGAATLLLDAAKGAASVGVALAMTGSTAWGAAAGAAAIAGHCFPIWLRFRGGKGVATGCGAFMVLSPAAMSISLGVFILVFGITRIVAAGSVLAAIAFPVASAALGASLPATLWASGSCLLIVARHHENLKRMAGSHANAKKDGGMGGSL